MYETLTFTQEAGVATLTLNRPERMNALNTKLLVEMREALKTLLTDDSARVLLLRSNGKTFCAGVDMVSPRTGVNPDDKEGMLRDFFQPAYDLLKNLGIPTVAAVHGGALGAGMSLALSCDVVVAAESAFFQSAFINIGLGPDTAASWLLHRSLGEARATGMLLLGERLPAAEAAQWGLIWKCVPDSEFESEVANVVDKFAHGPTLAYSLTKRLLRNGMSATHQHAWATEAEYQAIAVRSSDYQEARAAFVAKRQPAFKGK